MSWSMRSPGGGGGEEKVHRDRKILSKQIIGSKICTCTSHPLIEYDKIKIPSKGGISGRKDYCSTLPDAKLPFCWNVALENMTLLEIFPKEI